MVDTTNHKLQTINSLETHPFKPFVPHGIEYLIIGSFPGKGQTENVSEADWFYGAKRNTFWKILEAVYDIPLADKKAKQQLFIKTKMGIADIILKAVRTENTNSDTNLNIVEFNDKAIKKILEEHQIKIIFFTSQFVQKIFKKIFPDVTNTIVLPSPSPRYARMSLKEKVEVYKRVLPKI